MTTLSDEVFTYTSSILYLEVSGVVLDPSKLLNNKRGGNGFNLVISKMTSTYISV